jgi:hypothetical protein
MRGILARIGKPFSFSTPPFWLHAEDFRAANLLNWGVLLGRGGIRNPFYCTAEEDVVDGNSWFIM